MEEDPDEQGGNRVGAIRPREKRQRTAGRPVRSKAGNDEGKESKSNRSIKISVFTILNSRWRGV
jgi:hypothetical protein